MHTEALIHTHTHTYTDSTLSFVIGIARQYALMVAGITTMKGRIDICMNISLAPSPLQEKKTEVDALCNSIHVFADNNKMRIDSSILNAHNVHKYSSNAEHIGCAITKQLSLRSNRRTEYRTPKGSHKNASERCSLSIPYNNDYQ